MIGTITPLVEVADGSRRHRMVLLAYTAGSVTAAAVMGSLLGEFGRLLGGPWSWGRSALVILTIGLAAIELGMIRRPAPLIRRQTQKLWTDRFGHVTSAVLWGIDLGFGLTTRVTFASYWSLVAAAIALGPEKGAFLMAGYGAGRAILVATGPLLIRRQPAEALGSELFRLEGAWHHLHGVVLLAMAALIVSEVVRVP